MPPQSIRFIDDSEFQLRPFVYGMTSEMDPNTFKITWELDTSQKYPIGLFVRGDP
jgi:peptide/nickel transport system permease protein